MPPLLLPKHGGGGDWVSATRLRGYLLKNTLGDWLNLYGEANGFQRDDTVEGYDERLVFAPFIMGQGGRFEEAVARHLASFHELTTISREAEDVRELEIAQQTFQALADGRSIIHQAVLWNPESMTYGAADFLIRSDVFDAMFPGHLAPGRGRHRRAGPWWAVALHRGGRQVHHRTRLQTGRGRQQRLVACLQGAAVRLQTTPLPACRATRPRRAFLLGRSWEQSSERVTNAMKRLGQVSMSAEVQVEVEAAAAWVRRLRSEGAQWQPLPTPTVPELWPSGGDWPWENAVKDITDETGGPHPSSGRSVTEKRDKAVRKGITSWLDPQATAESARALRDRPRNRSWRRSWTCTGTTARLFAPPTSAPRRANGARSLRSSSSWTSSTSPT